MVFSRFQFGVSWFHVGFYRSLTNSLTWTFLDIFVFGLLQYFNIQYMLSGKKRCLWFLDIFVFGLLFTVLSYALDFANTIHFFSQVGSKMRKPTHTHRKKYSRGRIVQEHRDNQQLNKKYTTVFQKTKVQVADPKILPFFPASLPVVLVRYLQKPSQL